MEPSGLQNGRSDISARQSIRKYGNVFDKAMYIWLPHYIVSMIYRFSKKMGKFKGCTDCLTTIFCVIINASF